MPKLDGKVAVITGGTSGMALATAKRFVAEGAHVFITGRRKDKLDQAVADIGHNVTGVQGNAGDLADLDHLAEVVRAEKGRVDVLFASAAAWTLASIDQITADDFDTVFGVNARGTLFTVQKLLPLMSNGASIILNGSVGSVQGIAGNTLYAASKAALRSFARSWTADLKDRRIRVNVLSPGAIQTPAFETMPEEFKDRIPEMVPLGRPGADAEIASAVLFLASAEGGYVTGIDLPVDGGLTQV
ncbi:SDR family oxidoreductase [Streptomyces sp. GMY02]|uniref:SDR family oxidoreductase n=1 Tax=Streptomyces sp. GMY02 TaxID=1333528 RepID=UPI001C2B7CF5|nr:SDR family oxidoreductase [Streptomyces sp. GMY02]QXE33855.1 SDR family oxidoreductase [Streptomyces sp. GMY02]